MTNDDKFIIIMCPAFFARVRPVTRNAKPTCMNSTRKPVSSSHVRLIEIPRWATWLVSWLSPTCETGIPFVTPSGLLVATLVELASVDPVPPGSPLFFVTTPTAIRMINVSKDIEKSFFPLDTPVAPFVRHGPRAVVARWKGRYEGCESRALRSRHGEVTETLRSP